MRSTITLRLIACSLAFPIVAAAMPALTIAGGPPIPPGTTLGAGGTFTGSGTPIPDAGGYVTSPIVVTGLGPYLWDIDVNVTITHPNAQDLELALISPPPFNYVVTLSTGNGGANALSSQDLLFDDSANTAVAQQSLPAASVLVIPEGALTSLQSIDPNGTWTLRCRDNTLNTLAGSLDACSVTLTTLTATSPLTTYGPTTFVAGNNAVIPDDGVHSLYDPLVVGGGMGQFMAEVHVFVMITHPEPGQLEIGLEDASGNYVPLSLHNGGSNADVLSNTTWRDSARSGADDLPTTDAAYSPNVAQLQLVPEGALGRFIGLDPNAGWSLRVRDTVLGQAGPQGMLIQWSLTFWTYDPPQAAICVSGHSANNCIPVLSVFGDANNPLVLAADNIDGQKIALFFYGISGVSSPAGVWGPWSTYCVKTPVQRTPVQISGGNIGQCDGTALLHWSSYLAANPYALGNPIADGTWITTQLWWRDPASPKTTQLSGVMQFQSQP